MGTVEVGTLENGRKIDPANSPCETYCVHKNSEIDWRKMRGAAFGRPKNTLAAAEGRRQRFFWAAEGRPLIFRQSIL